MNGRQARFLAALLLPDEARSQLVGILVAAESLRAGISTGEFLFRLALTQAEIEAAAREADPLAEGREQRAAVRTSRIYSQVYVGVLELGLQQRPGPTS